MDFARSISADGAVTMATTLFLGGYKNIGSKGLRRAAGMTPGAFGALIGFEVARRWMPPISVNETPLHLVVESRARR